jgi:hypothetical protein
VVTSLQNYYMHVIVIVHSYSWVKGGSGLLHCSGQESASYPDDRSSTSLRNVDQYPADCMVPLPIRQQFLLAQFNCVIRCTVYGSMMRVPVYSDRRKSTFATNKEEKFKKLKLFQ